MSKAREKSASKNKGFFKLNTVKKKMIAGFMLLTLINIIAFLAFQMYSTYGQVEEEALDKSYAYAEHIEKIISPIGISQTEKLQSKISSLLTEEYKTAAYIGVLDSNLKYVENTDKTKIGTEFKTEETENAIKANKSISFTLNSKGNKEYISIVPLYDVTMVSGVDSEASATAKIDVPGLVIVSMDTGLMLSHEKAEFLKIIGIGCILLAFSIAIAAIISREITNPLKGVRNHLHEMAEGDFTKAVIVKSNDELLDLANDLNKTNVVLKDMISDIKSTAGVLNKYSQELNNSTNNIAGASEEISQSMDEIAGSSACQSDNLSNTVNTVNIFSINLDNINLNIHGIKGDSIQIKEIADDERYKIKELLSAMKEVQNCFEAVKNKIDNLSNSVGQIHLVTETINSVAKQTNLLSLNASIEAARAGKEGGGFIVVAHEVGKLAEQTLQAANNISSLIRNISESTNVVAVTATEAINKVQTQSFIISDTVTKFNGIVDKVNIVIPQINQVAETLDETIAMKDDILMNIKSIASASEGMAASSEQVSALTQEQSATILNLSSLSEQLNMTSDSMLENIDKFKVE